MTEAEKREAIEKAMSQYDSLGYTFQDEKARQSHGLQKRLQLRRQRLERTRRIRMVYGEEQQRKNAIASRDALQSELMMLTSKLVHSEDDELYMALKEWAAARDRQHKEFMMVKLAKTVMQLDPQLLSGLILKLKKVETSLKDLRKTWRRKNK